MVLLIIIISSIFITQVLDKSQEVKLVLLKFTC